MEKETAQELLRGECHLPLLISVRIILPAERNLLKLTRGLLRRSHIVANRHRYIGKETSRRWEQGDDLSMVDFRCTEYSDGKTAADQQLRKRIAEIGIRKTARATQTDSKTIMLISRGERVKPSSVDSHLSCP